MGWREEGGRRPRAAPGGGLPRHEVVKRTDDTSGFVVLPRRWVVERTLSWLMRSRRLVRDYETLPAKHEAMVLWSKTMLMSSRPTVVDHGPPARTPLREALERDRLPAGRWVGR
ncbi:transposase [Streptomyces sp. WAC05374]|uniref:transposase n=1 Tax=Streptomyces sp. WAC05374 TaxID=2487420 RepID=UPI002E136563